MGKRKMGNNGPLQRIPKRPRGAQRKDELPNDYDLVSPLDYVTTGGFHFARPYAFEFRTTYKPRFANRTVLSVFCDEFRHVEDAYWPREFRRGRVLLLDQHTKIGAPLSPGQLWRSGMVVVHIIHRHESAVPSVPIKVAVDESDFLVVSKPAGMPVHPSGTYRRNTLQFLLRAFPPPRVDHKGPLFIVHRLDKETSGLVILAKKSAAAARFAADIRDHRVQKLYLAHVHGVFPSNEVVCEGSIAWDNKKMQSKVHESGSDAQTKFRRIAFDTQTKTSVVECWPLTGRTHQIRVHLSHLGHPIVDDTLYGGHNLEMTTTTTTTTTTTATSLSPPLSGGIIPRFLQHGLTSLASSWHGGSNAGQTGRHADLNDPSTMRLLDAPFKESAEQAAQNRSYRACHWAVDARKGGKRLTAAEEGVLLECANCPQVSNIKNVERGAMEIRLHALRYQSEQWSFEVGPPTWMPDWCSAKGMNGEQQRDGERRESYRRKREEDDTEGQYANKRSDGVCVVM